MARREIRNRRRASPAPLLVWVGCRAAADCAAASRACLRRRSASRRLPPPTSLLSQHATDLLHRCRAGGCVRGGTARGRRGGRAAPRPPQTPARARTCHMRSASLRVSTLGGARSYRPPRSAPRPTVKRARRGTRRAGLRASVRDEVSPVAGAPVAGRPVTHRPRPGSPTVSRHEAGSAGYAPWLPGGLGAGGWQTRDSARG